MWHLVFVLELLECGISLRKLLAVLIHIVKIGIDDDALCRHFTITFCVTCCIKWYKTVGHDATTTIDNATLAKCLIAERVREVDTIGIRQLTFVVTIDNIFGIALQVSLLVRLLNAASAGSVITSRREANHTAVGHIEGTLYQPFSKGATSHNNTTVLILDGSRKNLCCRSTILVDKNRYPTLLEATATGATKLLVRHAATFGINNHIAFLEKFTGYVCCCLKEASRVLLEVDDEILHAFVFELLYGINHLFVCRLSEIVETNETNGWCHHVGSINRVDRNPVALDIKI